MDIAANARPEFTFLKTLPTAMVMTLCLFYLMHLLIQTDVIDEPIDEMPIIADILYIPQVIENRLTEPKPKLADDPVAPPPVPKVDLPKVDPSGQTTTPGEGFRFIKPTLDPVIGISNGAIVQQVMVPPTYPNRALNLGIEGYVDVQFSVTAMGSTDNVQVVAAVPENVFDRAALRAVKRWKYLPDEARKASPAVLRERIRFSIQD